MIKSTIKPTLPQRRCCDIIKIKETIIVEGTYDKIKLNSIVDAAVIATDGFSIFKDKEKLTFIRTMAKKTGIIVLTDSDGAGFQIRNHLKQGLAQDEIKHAYIPDVFGKERRKDAASKEGKLGVEGVDAKLIVTALVNAGATVIGEAGDIAGNQAQPSKRTITRLDFYNDGITGGTGSAKRRRGLAKKVGLPERISANMLAEIINIVVDYDEYCEILKTL